MIFQVVLSGLSSHHTDAKALIKSSIFPDPWVRDPASGAGAEAEPATVADITPSGDSVFSTTSNNGNGNGVGSSVTATKKKGIDPTNAPADTLRGRLIRHMISLDSQLKRVVAELIFLLCDEDGERRVYIICFSTRIYT